MRDPNLNYVKVIFEVEGYDTVEIESIWAVVEEDGYRLDNIPFYASGYAFGDIVSAAADPDGLLRCTGLVRASGHSTIRILCRDPEHMPSVGEALRAMGCAFEIDPPALITIDVPPDVPYADIQSYLDERVRTGEFLEYEEGCLAQ